MIGSDPLLTDEDGVIATGDGDVLLFDEFGVPATGDGGATIGDWASPTETEMSGCLVSSSFLGVTGITSSLVLYKSNKWHTYSN
jgi:hypothetical protein